MTTVPAPTIVFSREEWADTDFDLPDGDPIHAGSDKEDDQDWDIEMDLGKTGGAKFKIPSLATTPIPQISTNIPHMFTIRPPISSPSTDATDDDDDEGVSTIKFAVLPKPIPKPATPATIDEDFEDAFALPSDLTQLSLRPLSLIHRSSKSSLEWGDKDQTSSSQSSDAYSTLGFADHSPSSNYTSASLPETETEEEEDEGDLDGLVIPSSIFASGHSALKLNKLLEAKKKTAFNDVRVKIASPDPEDDFEIGLVLDDDTELSPSRLLQNAQSKPKRVVSPPIIRSKSVPPRPPTVTRPPSRLRADRAKSPSNPPVSSASQLRRLNAPPSPPRSQSYSQALTSAPPSSTPTFLAPKAGSLRVQKSHSGLKPASPPTSRKLTRKASLPALSDSTQAQASGSGLASGSGISHNARYDTPTASSRAKVHTNSTSRMHGLDYNVPPTRPSTPSSNPVALRLTMPTSSSRLKTRASISSVFPGSATATAAPPLPTRTTSPPHHPPTRPPSSTSLRSRHAQTQSLPLPPPVKVLKRPKRQKTYGDGNELDLIEDLPLDREKEARYRVQPKGNRVPGASYSSKTADKSAESSSNGKGTLRRSKKRDLSGSGTDMAKVAPPTKTLKRTGRLDTPPPPLPLTKSPSPELIKRKKPATSQLSSSQTRRKPTLIRNLGGAGAPKVVGEMKWNPQTLRWEGNDQALRDFDAAVGTSIRPALITHLTGTSIGAPCGSFAAGARKVGNMMFDPQRMCWISTLPPEEDEPDVFADLADDENDDWEAKGGTIRANQQAGTTAPVKSSSTRIEAPSPARSHSRGMSGSESDRGSRASMVCHVDEGFAGKCRAAEERHRSEMRGWASRHDVFAEPNRSYLYEIRALATRRY